MSLYVAFNTAVRDLLEDLASAYPMNAEFSSLVFFHNRSCSANVRLTHELFQKHVLSKYGDMVKEKNYAFFESDGVNAPASRPGVQGIIDSIRGEWRGMSGENKTRVKDHVDLIAAISDAISGDGE